MITFKLAPHSVLSGVQLVEIWDEGEMIGSIYPTEVGIKVISKHVANDLEGVIHIERHQPASHIPEILINIRSQDRS